MSDQVFYDSDKADKRVTLTGWVSRQGRFFGDDEHRAHYDGGTVLFCKCEMPYEKCSVCQD